MNRLFDIRMLRECYSLGETYSDDPRTKLGALLVKDGKIISTGVNQIIPGLSITKDKLNLKKYYIEHAERMCLIGHSKYDIIGSTLYCPWFSCAECARVIGLMGISRVVGHKHPFQCENVNWAESIEHGNNILDELGIIRHYIEEFLDITVTFMGRKVTI